MPVETPSMFAQGDPGPSRAQESGTRASRTPCRSRHYKNADPFDNHPLFKTEEQARLEETMDGERACRRRVRKVLAWPGENASDDEVVVAPNADEGDLWGRAATSTGATNRSRES